MLLHADDREIGHKQLNNSVCCGGEIWRQQQQPTNEGQRTHTETVEISLVVH